MRFTEHLSSHLTLEWRKHYINYETLKKLIYEIVGQSEPSGEEGRKADNVLIYTVARASNASLK